MNSPPPNSFLLRSRALASGAISATSSALLAAQTNYKTKHRDMKKRLIAGLIISLFAGSSAFGAWVDWTGAVDNDFNNSGNWTGVFPDSGNRGNITTGGAIVTTSAAVDVGGLAVYGTGTAPVLNISHDMTIGSQYMYVGGNGDGDGVVNQTAGTVSTDRVYLGIGVGNTGEYNFSGGVLSVSGLLLLGSDPGDVGIVRLSGSGTVNVAEYKSPSWQGVAQLHVTGGNLAITCGVFRVSTQFGAAGEIRATIDSTGISTINVTGDCELRNNLNFVLSTGAGYTHVNGTEYTIIDAAAFTGDGAFGNVADGDIIGVDGNNFTANYDAVAATFTLTATSSEPPTLIWENDMSADPAADGWEVDGTGDNYTMSGGLLTMDAGAYTTLLNTVPWNPFNGVTTVDLEWRATSVVADKGAGIWCNVDVDQFAETYGQVIFHSLLLAGDTDTQTFKIINAGSELVTITGFSTNMLTLHAVIDSVANTVSYEVTDGTTTKSGIESYTDTKTWESDSPACTLSTAGPSAEIDYVRIEANATLYSYGDWAISYPGLTDDDATLDFDGGSLETGLEYVLGIDPTDASDDLAVAPISTMNGTMLEFDFRRTDVARDDSSTTIVAEYSLDLSGWTTAEDGVDGVTIAVTNDFYGVGIDRVVVSLPDTLATDDKIFARLKVTVAP